MLEIIWHEIADSALLINTAGVIGVALLIWGAIESDERRNKK